MDPIKIISSPLVNKSELARRLYPDNKGAVKHLQNKIAGRQGQTINSEDRRNIINIFSTLVK